LKAKTKHRNKCYSATLTEVFASNIILLKKLASSLQFAHLYAKLPQPGDSEVTFTVFELNCHLYYQSSRLKGGNPVECLAQENKQTYRLIFTLSFQY